MPLNLDTMGLGLLLNISNRSGTRIRIKIPRHTHTCTYINLVVTVMIMSMLDIAKYPPYRICTLAVLLHFRNMTVVISKTTSSLI